jgi:GT2 family glycosyltransferase
MVIVDDGEDDALKRWLESTEDRRITYVRLPPEGKSLGQLRNIAVERATGDFVAQWDDDDLSDPMRLEIQLAAIRALRTDACFLERHRIWWPDRRRLTLSCRRIWESSFVCAKDRLPAYPALRQGEDTPVIAQIVEEGRSAVLDCPQLYTYVFHGANTFAAQHWEAHWLAATESYEGDMYDIMIEQLQDRLELDLSPWISHIPAAAPGPASAAGQDSAAVPGEDSVLSEPGQPYAPFPCPSRRQPVTAEAPPSAPPFPKVLILTPVKDAVPFLPGYWEKLHTLTYPHDHISVAFLDSDSIDGTYDFIAGNLPHLQAEFDKAKLFKRDFAYRSTRPRWEPSEQFNRRSTVAKSRNHLLARALEDEDWVLWIDVDVARWPNDVIEQLLASGKDIVVPNCLSERTGDTFDYNTFKLTPEAEELDWSPYIVDGILQPPKGFGRLYLSDLGQHDCVEVDAVGGTMLLIRADIHREGLVFPTFSYKLHIETEGLALMAKDMGYRCWGLPKLEIYHP